MLIPPKLKPGDTIRVIAPSGSYMSPWIREDYKVAAKKKLEQLGFNVTFGKHLQEVDDFMSSSVEHRLEDIHDAFADPAVRMISCARGGFNANQLLTYLDYDLIRKNPKILCGFSDITALSNAIYAKTGLVGYSGPNYYQFGQAEGLDYTLSYFMQCLMQDAPYMVEASSAWMDADKGKRDTLQTMTNAGLVVINEGQAEGTLLGANLCTFNLLQGTAFFPDIRDAVLCIEDDDFESQPINFDRNLQSLLHQPQFASVRGLLIGRFQLASGMTDDFLRQIVQTKQELKNMPIIANVDFGHTQPLITFPIGGKVRIDASAQRSAIEVIEH